MANVKAIATGNWSAGLAVFSAIPQPGDNVFSNGFIVTINVDISVASISNAADATSGAAAGGQFLVSGSRNISANVLAGSTATPCLSITGAVNTTLTGNATGGTANGAYGINHSSTGTLTMIGNLIGGTVGNSGSMGLYNSGASGSIVQVGNITSGAGEACFTGGAGSWTTTGTIQAGAVVGLVCGNTGSGIITINGNCIGSATGSGAGVQVANGTFTVTVNGAAIAGESTNVNFTHVGVYCIVITANVKVATSQSSTRGIGGTLGFVKYINTTSPTVKVYRENGTSITLTDPAAGIGLNASDLRASVVVAGITGTLKVPSPANVRKGVLTDNTEGTAEVTAADLLNEIQVSLHPVAKRLRICSTIDSEGEHLKDFLNS